MNNIISRSILIKSLSKRCYSSGQKNSNIISLDAFKTSFDSKVVEENKYQFWENNDLFKPKSRRENASRFSLVLPPPNITGSLHIGHALTNTIQDIVVRYQRMMGNEVLWVPGLDHSGIATQVVVEKEIKSRFNKSRYDLGKDKFIQQVFEWNKEYSTIINNQLRMTGSSLDWSRSVFTLDKQRDNAVKEAFVRLFDQGLIYRSTRLVNWCPQLQSVISDIEVDHMTIEKPTQLKLKTREKTIEVGVIYNIRYKVIQNDGEEVLDDLIVSTTRPETIFGDTAVAIHPQDARYLKYHNRKVQHPFLPKQLPIVLDSILVDMKLGTGVVKITPAHDFNDYQCSQRHNLEQINILNSNGTLNEQVPIEYQGVDRIDARYKVIEALKTKGLYIDKKPHPTQLHICSRSGDLLEPVLKPQWYVNCKQMAEKAVEYVKSGQIKFSPEHHQDSWFRWLENIQDWCISRQLWWGNEIPVYKVHFRNQIVKDEESDSDVWVAGKTKEEVIQKVQNQYKCSIDEFTLHQDPDVLDTWFSSSLFPISSLGWPNTLSEDYQKYYPLNLMETGSDILFFWVARMVMMCSTLTGTIPFSTILLHPMIRDSQGRKMSKSLGNVIDPLHVINGVSLQELKDNLTRSNLSEKEKQIAVKGLDKEFPNGIQKCGVDSLRISLSQYPLSGKDINLDMSKIMGNRLFCNKMWNASKFVMQQLADQPDVMVTLDMDNTKFKEITPIDKWILSEMQDLIAMANQNFQTYNLSQISQTLYSFFQYDFCDFYLESFKVQSKTKESYMVLLNVLEQFLRLIHPFMPYISEDLWQRLPKISTNQYPISIMITQYPQVNSSHDQYKDIKPQIHQFKEIIHQIRSFKTQHSLTNQPQSLTIELYMESQQMLDTISQQKNVLEKITNCSVHALSLLTQYNPSTITDKDHIKPNTNFNLVFKNPILTPTTTTTITNNNNNSPSHQQQKEKIKNLIAQLENEINSPLFKEKVPANVQKLKLEKLEKYKLELLK
ncbi:hypothetical protein DLAC_00277 [Tieghemostelium lacteum]|uniref:valine--tRNA ligase n=1 Tax=Tieghemostelium lacteum TaxID=361077 RepID=A0A152A9K6_TIELA|nr:hypothetical protein DLAC_00277 [Tieghemostelium lacteum]|eukprot:KYR02811.1 hypothetical protein DLAC_00277 [Tieghemostelium lacteum]